MKTSHFIAPAVAVVAGLFWISRQETTLTELQEKTRVVQERLGMVSAARAASDPDRPDAGETRAEKDEFLLPDGSLDWDAIATIMAEMQKSGGMPSNMKTMMKLQARLMEMTEDEIIEGMARIDNLDLEDTVKEQLKTGLLQQLAEKNPQKALDLMEETDDSQENQLQWVRQSAFSKLAKDDPLAAMAWLDRQVNEGKLVSKALDPSQSSRLPLESALIGKLFENDPAAARARIATFDENERVRLFSNAHEWRQGGKMPEEFLTLARENLNDEEATSAIAEAWSGHYNVELKDISESLKAIPFTDKERSAVVEKSIENFTRSNRGENTFETAYEWAAEQAPGQAGSIVAKALFEGRHNGKSMEDQFEQSIQLSEKFNDPSIVTEFARRFDPENSQEQFKDPALQEKLHVIRETLPQENE